MKLLPVYGDWRCINLKVLTIQSGDLNITARVFPDKTKCNYAHALPVYKRLFEDYNARKGTSYEAFFWAFSDLQTEDLSEAVYRATEMLGMSISMQSKEQVFILDVPDDLCLVTDFYNFSDEIYAYENPRELASVWENIYSDRIAEKQVIFPYFEDSMLLMRLSLKDFAIQSEEMRNNRMVAMLNRVGVCMILHRTQSR